MQVAIRADASELIGIGHIMRCLTLADGLREHGANVEFICRELRGNGIDLIRSRGYSVHILSGRFTSIQAENKETIASSCSWFDWRQDSEETAKTLQSLAVPQLLVVDHYKIDCLWLKRIRSLAEKIMVIDDLVDRNVECDILLDQTHGREKSDYKKYVPEDCTLLTGSEFALLRPQFLQYRPKALKDRALRKGIKTILVSIGGYDANNVTSTAIEAISSVAWDSRIKVDIVLAGTAPSLRQVQKEVQQNDLDIEIHSNVTDMAALMAKADIAIGAGGTTIWEQLCLGLPVIVVSTADNQKDVVAKLKSAGAIIYVGEAVKVTSADIAETLQMVKESVKKAEELSKVSRKIIDGLGVERVVESLYQTVLGKVTLRAANHADCRKLFSWQKDPNSRRYCRNPHPPTWEEHKRWFEVSMENPLRKIFVVEDDGTPVGVVRLDICKDKPEEAEVSILISPGWKKRKYGKRALIALRRRFNAYALWAEVLPANKVSQKLFASVGYQRSAGNWYISLPKI